MPPESPTPESPSGAFPIPASPTDAQMGVVQAIAGKNPMIAGVLVLLLGGGAGTAGSLFIAPAINDHEKDPRAHAVEFAQLATIERRLDRMETNMDGQDRELSDIKAGIDAAIRELRNRP